MTTPNMDFGYYSYRVSLDGPSGGWALIDEGQRNGSMDRHLMQPGTYLVQLVGDGNVSGYIRWRPDGSTVRQICRIEPASGKTQQASSLVPIIADKNADLAVYLFAGDGTPRRAAVRIFADPQFTP